MREALAFALLACACVTRPRPESPAAASATPTPPPGAATSTPTPTSTAAPFLDLAARFQPSVPGMHVVATHEGGLDAFEIARAADAADLCVRVAFEATEPVTATLADGTGARLATRTAGSGLLAADGPVCVRRGDTIRAAAAGPPGTQVRWVAWSTGH